MVVTPKSLNAPPVFPTVNLAASIEALLAQPGGGFTAGHWSVHGVTLDLHTDHLYTQTLISDLLRPFAALAAPVRPDVRVVFTCRQTWAVPPQAEMLPPSSNEVIDVQASYGLTSTLARTGNLNYLELSPLGGAAYDLRNGLALAYLPQPEAYRPWVITHLFLITLTMELLRGRGLYWLHAAAAADRGRAALIIGQTGAGKTTTCLALVAGGFKFLSEDRTFVRVNGDAVELLAFPKEVAVTGRTLELLPWLKARLAEPGGSRRKQEIDPAALFPEALVSEAKPGVILFPRQRPEAPSEARPLAGAAALQRILPNSLLASQPQVSAQHFDALARLVAGSRCYELLVNPKVGALPGLVRGLLP